MQTLGAKVCSHRMLRVCLSEACTTDGSLERNEMIKIR
jgi:hypothetical protein